MSDLERRVARLEREQTDTSGCGCLVILLMVACLLVVIFRPDVLDAVFVTFARAVVAAGTLP